jgi:hypothetical protein
MFVIYQYFVGKCALFGVYLIDTHDVSGYDTISNISTVIKTVYDRPSDLAVGLIIWH